MSDALLTSNDKMEALSRVYIGAVAAKAGFLVGRAEPDRDSVDLFLTAGGHMRPQIGIQAKATTTIPAGTSQFSFQLNKKNYNDLRIPTQSPRLLVVLTLPKNEDDWMSLTADQLVLRRCAYWKSLLGLPEITSETKVVPIDTAQVFDVAALIALMDKSRNGAQL